MNRDRHQQGGAPGQRQLRVGEVIRRALSEILARGETHDPDLARASITVSEVRCSPDLRHATAFVLPLGGVNTASVVKALTRNKAELRRLVTARIDLRFSPELSFQPDESFDRMDRARDLFASPEVARDLEAPDAEGPDAEGPNPEAPNPEAPDPEAPDLEAPDPEGSDPDAGGLPARAARAGDD